MAAQDEHVSLSASLLPNAHRLTHTRQRKDAVPDFACATPTTAIAIRNKPQLRRRWLILVLTALIMGGSYYVYDEPAALLSVMQREYGVGPSAEAQQCGAACGAASAPKGAASSLLGGGDAPRFCFARVARAGLRGRATPTQQTPTALGAAPCLPPPPPLPRRFELYYEMMYSVYSLPNIVLPLIGGVLIDRVGVVFALNMFSFIVLLGQLTFAAGSSAHSLQVRDLVCMYALLVGVCIETTLSNRRCGNLSCPPRSAHIRRGGIGPLAAGAHMWPYGCPMCRREPLGVCTETSPARTCPLPASPPTHPPVQNSPCTHPFTPPSTQLMLVGRAIFGLGGEPSPLRIPLSISTSQPTHASSPTRPRTHSLALLALPADAGGPGHLRPWWRVHLRCTEFRHR